MIDWLLLCWLIPLLLAPCALIVFLNQGNGGSSSSSYRALQALPALAAVPAVAASLLLPTDSELSVAWLLLGSEFAISALDRPFLFAAGLVYLAAGIYLMAPDSVEGRSPGFVALFLMTMAGNLLLICAQDPVSFYLGFTLMSLSAYGLVIFKRGKHQLFAGKVYLVLTLIGEVALLFAFLLLAQRTGLAADLAPSVAYLLPVVDSAQGLLEQFLFVLGFGIKGGLLGLHMWLPLAHPAAPVAASAVLSGVMIKAALIGLLRYLPIGEPSLVVGDWLLWLSLAGAVLAGAVATVQREPKVVLAYSSVAKMGMAMAMIAVMLLEPVTVPLLVPMLGLFALYHGICKAALFLGVGWYRQFASQQANPLVWLLLLLVPAWILIGAPFGAGAVLKARLYAELDSLGGADSVPALYHLIGIAPVLLFLSVLLVCRLLWLLHQQVLVSVDRQQFAEDDGSDTASQKHRRPQKYGGGIQLLAVVLLILAAVGISFWLGELVQPSFYDLLSIAAALPIVTVILLSQTRAGLFWSKRLPPGDLLIYATRASRTAVYLMRTNVRGEFDVVSQRLKGVGTGWFNSVRVGINKFFQKSELSVAQHAMWMVVFAALLLAITLPGIRG